MAPPQTDLHADSPESDTNHRPKSSTVKESKGRKQQKKRSPSPDYVDDADYVGKVDEDPLITGLRKTLKGHHNTVIRKCLAATYPLRKQILDSERANRKAMEEHDLELQRREDEFEQYKMNTMKHLASKGYDPEDDGDVRREFRKYFNNMRILAKSMSKDGHAAILDKVVKLEVLEALSTGPNRSCSKADVATSFAEDVAISTLVNTLLAKHVFTTLLSRPFFFLSGMESKNLAVDLPLAIEELFQIGQNADADFANVWLAHTMTLLHPKRARSHHVPINRSTTIEMSKTAHYAKCASDFLYSSAVQPLLKLQSSSEIQKRNSDVNGLLADIGELMLHLANQKVRLKIMAYDDLLTHRIDSKKTLMRAHGSMSEERFEKLHDSGKILLVVVPAVVAYGSEEGTDYHEYKVWSPATVIIGPNEEPTTDLSTPQSLNGSTVTRTVDLTDDIADSVHNDNVNVSTSRNSADSEPTVGPASESNTIEEIAQVGTIPNDQDSLLNHDEEVVSSTDSCLTSSDIAAEEGSAAEITVDLQVGFQAQSPCLELPGIPPPTLVDAIAITQEELEEVTEIPKVNSEAGKRKAQLTFGDQPAKKARVEQSPSEIVQDEPAKTLSPELEGNCNTA